MDKETTEIFYTEIEKCLSSIEMPDQKGVFITPNMTAKQYAAIHLKLPRSGGAEIDAMIRESRRAEFAGQALAGYSETIIPRLAKKWCRKIADALIAELDEGTVQ